MRSGFAPQSRTDVARGPVEDPARAPLPAPLSRAGVLALQRSAGNAAVGRVLARQPADTDVKSSRRSVVIWEGRQLGKRVKFKSKLSLRGQIPKGTSDTIDSIVGATEAENVRRKSSALETEFIALDGDIWKLTPAAFQKRMKELGVKATIEFEPFDAAVKTADAAEYKLPSIDLMKFNAKLEWSVGKTIVELELSASLSPTILLGAADRKLLQQFERKVAELRKEMLEIDKTKAHLVEATKRTEEAQKALDTAERRAAERKGTVDRMKSARADLQKAQTNRGAADRAAAAARKRRDDALKNLKAKNLGWDAYKKQSQELLEKSAKEIAPLERKALEALSAERSAEQALKARVGEVERIAADVPKNEVKRASERVASAKTAENRLKRKIEDGKKKVTKLGKQAVDIAKKGKSWVFHKIVGPRMIRVLGFLAKAIPILNVISLAADLYELGKLLWNWDKLKFGLGGGDGGAGGSGTAGKPDSSGKGSGTGGTGTSQAPGGGSGSDPWDPDAPQAPAPTPGDPPAGGVTKPDVQGTSKTGTGTSKTGTGTTPPQQPGKPGGKPGQGNDPAGTSDDPGGTGTPGGTTTGTGKTSTTGGGQSTGGKDPKAKPGKDPATKPDDKKKQGGATGKGGSGRTGGKGMPGKADDPAAKKVKKPAPPAVKHVKAIPIKQAAADDVDVFAAGGTVQIAKFTGLNPWTAGRGKAVTRDTVHLTVKHDGHAYRVYGVPIVVVRRMEDLPPKTAGEDEYMISLTMQVSQNLRLAGTKLVINKGDELYYTWEGSY